MLISETSKVSVLYVTAKFSRKSNFSAKVLSSIDITSPNIFVSTTSSIFKDSCWSLRSTTTFAVTLFSHVVVLIMKLQRSHWITSVQVPWRIFLLQCLHLKCFSIFCTECKSPTCNVSSVSVSVLLMGIWHNAGSSNGWTTVRVVVDSFFFPDQTLTCKLVSVYTKPAKRRKTCWKGVDADAVKESYLKLPLIHIQSLKKVSSWYYSCSEKEELDNTSNKIQITKMRETVTGQSMLCALYDNNFT